MRPSSRTPLAVVLVLACSGGTGPEEREPSFSDEPVHRIAMSPRKPRINVGELLALQAVAYNAAGRVIQRPRLVWTSSDPTVASVGETGVVRGLSAGYIELTVKSGTASDFTTLHVQVNGVYPEVVLLEPASLQVTSCTPLQLSARTLPDIGDHRFAWRSSDVEIAQVSSTGLLTGVAPGSALITVLWAPDTSRRAVRSALVQSCP